MVSCYQEILPFDFYCFSCDVATVVLTSRFKLCSSFTIKVGQVALLSLTNSRIASAARVKTQTRQ